MSARYVVQRLSEHLPCYFVMCCAVLFFALLFCIMLQYAVLCHVMSCCIMSSHVTCLHEVGCHMQVQLPSSQPQAPQAGAAVDSLQAGALQDPSSLLTAKSPLSFCAQMALPERPFGMRIWCPAAVPTALPRAPLTPFAPTCLPLLMVHLLTGMLKSALLLLRLIQLWRQGQAGTILILLKCFCPH